VPTALLGGEVRGPGLASLLFFFFVRRSLRRRESADLVGDRCGFNQIEQRGPWASWRGRGAPACLPATRAGLLTRRRTPPPAGRAGCRA